MKILFCTKCGDFRRTDEQPTKEFQRCRCGHTWIIYEGTNTLRCSTDAVILEIPMLELLRQVRDRQPVTLAWTRESDLDRDLPIDPGGECC